MRTFTLKPGEWWVTCMRSGMRVPSSRIRKEWNGLLVFDEWWEPRHPQDQIRGRRDDPSVRFSHNPADRFLATNEVTADDL